MTKTPWTHSKRSFPVLVKDADGFALFQITGKDAESIELAQQIVRAVNSHAALVEALEAAKDELADQHDRQVSIGDEPNIEESLFEKIDAALTLAKGA